MVLTTSSQLSDGEMTPTKVDTGSSVTHGENSGVRWDTSVSPSVPSWLKTNALSQLSTHTLKPTTLATKEVKTAKPTNFIFHFKELTSKFIK
eukprot:m.330882 g.330882  ORF g.330882 m.330882 type:complete len:92 (+) comp16600_c0_seq1:803-1078(+)